MTNMNNDSNQPIKVIIPKGIRHLKDWNDFSIPDFPCIIDKQVTGCGFTEFCLGNEENVVLCSPRKVLIENKVRQHNILKKGILSEVYYAYNKYEKPSKTDQNLKTKSKLEDVKEEEVLDEKQKEGIRQGVEKYFYYCFNKGIPCKILVTYDSFKYVKEVLIKLNQLENFRIIADEFQAIIQDAKFKSTTEIEFLDQLQGITKLCFVSATPILGAYLKLLPEFKDLPCYEFDWETEDPLRVSEPLLEPFYCPRGIIKPACDIVNEYKSGNFKTTTIYYDGEVREVTSKEAVFYVNCVNNICDIISRTGLTLDECNIICSTSEDNEKKLRKLFGVGKDVDVFGTIPGEGEPHKMFTFCTRTAYIGSDFYSTNARNFIFSDANIDCLTVDIQIDIPQILGRERLECNPWRNRAEVYFRLVAKNESTEHGEEQLTNKDEETNRLLNIYYSADEQTKKSLIKKFQKDYSNYKDDYVAINTDKNGNQTLVYNNLVRINDMMGWELLQKNYKNLYRMLTSLLGVDGAAAGDILRKINDIPYFHDKMQYIYELNMPNDLAKIVLDNIGDVDFSKYYWTIPAERAKALKYRRGNLETEYNSIKGIKSVDAVIYENFEVGQKYSKFTAKSLLQKIYDNMSISRTAKASDLSEYFEIRESKVVNTETGKRDAGFEIIKKK